MGDIWEKGKLDLAHHTFTRLGCCHLPPPPHPTHLSVALHLTYITLTRSGRSHLQRDTGTVCHLLTAVKFQIHNLTFTFKASVFILQFCRSFPPVSLAPPSSQFCSLLKYLCGLLVLFGCKQMFGFLTVSQVNAKNAPVVSGTWSAVALRSQ